MTDARAHLIEFLNSLPRVRPGEEARGLAEMDSLGLMQVVLYLENTYQINLAEHHIEPEDLRSIEGLLSIVARRRPIA